MNRALAEREHRCGHEPAIANHVGTQDLQYETDANTQGRLRYPFTPRSRRHIPDHRSAPTQRRAAGTAT
jgi:hypothetical protein